ncbi:MAG: hypothetical protein ACRDNG_04370 [Gaiellaceae bacterium]
MARQRQIEFPPEQSPVRWLTPAMLIAALACIVIVIVILLAHPSGKFIGPW